jgi:hypothetical protein
VQGWEIGSPQQTNDPYLSFPRNIWRLKFTQISTAIYGGSPPSLGRRSGSEKVSNIPSPCSVLASRLALNLLKIENPID